MIIKKLIVCLSKDLPPILDRSSDKVYFTYDKLKLYIGQNIVEENFAIVEGNLPKDPVNGMIYIKNTDGSIYRMVDYTPTKIAEIEDASQLDLLKKAGTIFYVNSNNRYLDLHTRTLTLPFEDGEYELNVNTKSNQIYDKNTILKFDERTNRFEVFGPQDEEFIDFSKPFRGGETESMKISVDGGRLRGDIKLSKALNNILRITPEGLYARTDDKVDKATFDEWYSTLIEFQSQARTTIDALDADVKYISSLITPEKISQDIMEILSEKFDDIEQALENYQSIVNSLDSIENILMSYASSRLDESLTSIEEEFEKNSSWQDLDNTSEFFTQEVNYYEKSEQYLSLDPTGDELEAILTAAVSAYIESEEEEK